jgi:hypothetical protein
MCGATADGRASLTFNPNNLVEKRPLKFEVDRGALPAEERSSSGALLASSA